MDITLRHLRQIEIIADKGSFAAAAKKLHISQPALSRSISSLEEQIDVKLFDRSRREVVPTVFGKHLLQRGKPVLRDMQGMERDLTLLRGLESGQLVVGSGPLPAEFSLGRAVAHFNRKYPKINVQIIIDQTPRLLDLLQKRELDLFVADTRMLDDTTDLTISSLAKQQGYFCCRKGHPVTRKKKVRVKDIFAYPMAVMWFPKPLLNSLASVADIALRDIRDLPQGIIECDHMRVLFDIIAESDSIGLITQAMLNRCIHAQEIVTLPITIPELNTHYGIVSLSHYSEPVVAEEFRHCMVKADSELQDTY